MIARGIIIAGIIIAYLDSGIFGVLFFLSGFLLLMLGIGAAHRSYYRSSRD